MRSRSRQGTLTMPWAWWAPSATRKPRAAGSRGRAVLEPSTARTLRPFQGVGSGALARIPARGRLNAAPAGLSRAAQAAGAAGGSSCGRSTPAAARRGHGAEHDRHDRQAVEDALPLPPAGVPPPGPRRRLRIPGLPPAAQDPAAGRIQRHHVDALHRVFPCPRRSRRSAPGWPRAGTTPGTGSRRRTSRRAPGASREGAPGRPPAAAPPCPGPGTPGSSTPPMETPGSGSSRPSGGGGGPSPCRSSRPSGRGTEATSPPPRRAGTPASGPAGPSRSTGRGPRRGACIPGSGAGPRRRSTDAGPPRPRRPPVSAGAGPRAAPRSPAAGPGPGSRPACRRPPRRGRSPPASAAA